MTVSERTSSVDWCARSFAPRRMRSNIASRDHGPGPTTSKNQEVRSCRFRAALVHHGPKSNLGRDRRRGQWRRAEVKRDLGRDNGHDHLDDERNGDGAGQQTEHEEQPAHDFERTHEVGGELWRRKPELGHPSDALIRIHELEDALGQEDSADDEPHEDGRGRGVERRTEDPAEEPRMMMFMPVTTVAVPKVPPERAQWTQRAALPSGVPVYPGLTEDPFAMNTLLRQWTPTGARRTTFPSDRSI